MGEDMPVQRLFDLTAGRACAQAQALHGKRRQAKMAVMRPLLAWGQGPPQASSPQLFTPCFSVASRPLSPAPSRRAALPAGRVVNRPAPPRPARRVGIVAQQGEAASRRRRAATGRRRRQVQAIAGIAPGNVVAVMKGAGAELHDPPPGLSLCVLPDMMLADDADGARLRPFLALLLDEADFRADFELVEIAIHDRVAVEIDFAAVGGFDEAAILAG